ncbi:MAG: glycosyl transferase family 1, partial [Chloroflexia bacterium]
MKIAFFTPLNPVQSGISDYSEELLVTLGGAKAGGHPLQIDIFIDKGNKPTNREVTEQFKVLPASDFRRLSDQYDATVYQMGNSAAHAYIYNELMRSPGVVVMHEFVLHHLRVWMTLNGGKRKEYISIMEQRHGAEGREAARRVLLGQFPEALFEYPLSDEVVHKAKGIIVHSRYMEGLVRQVLPDVPLAVVPMGVPLPPLIPKDQARARLGIDPDLFLVTSVGHLNPYKRVSTTLRAFKALLMEVP